MGSTRDHGDLNLCSVIFSITVPKHITLDLVKPYTEAGAFDNLLVVTIKYFNRDHNLWCDKQ
jgi:hypothetical protein